MLAISVAAELVDILSHVTENGRTLALVRHINDLLNHVVGIGVAHHALEHTVSLAVDGVVDIEGHVDDGPDHLVTVTTGSVLEALFNDVRRELVLREVEQVGWTSLIKTVRSASHPCCITNWIT